MLKLVFSFWRYLKHWHFLIRLRINYIKSYSYKKSHQEEKPCRRNEKTNSSCEMTTRAHKLLSRAFHQNFQSIWNSRSTHNYKSLNSFYLFYVSCARDRRKTKPTFYVLWSGRLRLRPEGALICLPVERATLLEQVYVFRRPSYKRDLFSVW